MILAKSLIFEKAHFFLFIILYAIIFIAINATLIDSWKKNNYLSIVFQL